MKLYCVYCRQQLCAFPNSEYVLYMSGFSSHPFLFLCLREQEVHDYLKSLCPSLHITRGEYDEDSRYPETKTLTIGQFKLGLCHGHQVSHMTRIT